VSQATRSIVIAGLDPAIHRIVAKRFVDRYAVQSGA
jgi:hypothetical protein